MTFLRGLGAFVGIMATAAIASAYPTLLGQTGTGVLPSAAVAPAGQVQVAADFYNTDDNAFPLRALYGVAPNFEIGAGYWLQDVNDENANTWDINAKYATPVRVLGFDWSLAALFANTDENALPLVATDNITGTQITWVGDRVIPLGGNDARLKGTLGINWTRIDFGADDGNAIRGFIGADFALANRLGLVGDIQTESDSLGDTDPLFSVALRYAATKGLGAQVGFTNAAVNGLVGGNDSNFFAGLNLSFGGGATDTNDGGY